jgi:hypothetical protein
MVAVLDGTVRTSSVRDDGVAIRHETGDLEAALLVVGEVAAGRDAPSSKDIGADDLDAAIEAASRRASSARRPAPRRYSASTRRITKASSHTGRRTHVHALVEDATGDVDALGIAAGARLRVPR